MTSTRRAFLRQLGLSAGAFAFLEASSAWAVGGLPRSTPEAEGVSSEGILAFLDAIAKSAHELHSFMMLRHGKVVAEGWWSPYGPELRHMLYSLSKSFTSSAVGFAVAENKLRVSDRVVSFFPNDVPANAADRLANLRVSDLLTMSVGNEKEPTGTVVAVENWVRTFLAQPLKNTPGTTFLYNSAATYMCSAIVQQVTGEKVVDYLRPRLFEPLGIEGATWETCPRGINTGGWGLSLRTEDLAKFGQLYLQKGKWNERPLLSAQWVEEATTFKIQQPSPPKPTRPKEQNDWLQGYGYQFWRCQHGAFRGDGAFGQYVIVLPEQDAVIAMTGESGNMQGELDLVWEHLLPALEEKALPADAAAAARLQTALGSLALKAPAGQRTSATAARVGGKTYTIQPGALHITSADFAFTDTTAVFTARTAETTHAVTCGIEQWHLGETAFPSVPPRIIAGGTPPAGTPYKIAASGRWKDEKTFIMTWRYIETPHRDAVVCQFEGDSVKISFISSISEKRGKPNEARATLTGRLT
jgi:CubicO group peptidase (beta-lactamase class C family)